MGGMGGLGGSGGKGSSGSRGGIFGFGQSTARIIKENTGVTFKLEWLIKLLDHKS